MIVKRHRVLYNAEEKNQSSEQEKCDNITKRTVYIHIITCYNRDSLKEFYNEGGKEMKKYVCDLCGYIYDPEEGDPENGVEAGTAWEDVPEDWVCPLCGADKDSFSEA